MQIKQTPGDKADTVVINVKNGETTAIEPGELVVFAMSGTDDGLLVKRPSSMAAATAHSFFAGIVKDRLPADGSKMGTAQIFGFCRRAKIVRMTRAASTDAWASYPAWAAGDRLIVNTVADALSRSDAGAATVNPGVAIAIDTLASATTIASGTASTGLAVTAWAEVFLRAL